MAKVKSMNRGIDRNTKETNDTKKADSVSCRNISSCSASHPGG